MDKNNTNESSAISLKKQLIYIGVFVLLIAVTLYAIVGQNKDLTLGGFIDYTLSLKIPWLIAGIGCVFLFILFEGMSIRYIAAKLGYKRGLYNSFLYSAADIYFSAITPSATGGQPASAYFMVKDKIPMSVTTITLVMNIAQYTFTLVVLSAMCFIIRPEYFYVFDGWSQTLILLGILFQLLFTVVFALVIFFPDIIRKLGEGVINFLFRIHLLRKRRKKLNDLYKMIEEYRECARIIKGSPIILLVTFVFNMLQRFAAIAVTYCVYMGSGQSEHSIVDIMTMQGYVLVGTNSLPVPGGVGVADYLFFDGFKDIFADPANGELLSRGLSFYVCIIVCGALTLAHQARLMMKNKRG